LTAGEDYLNCTIEFNFTITSAALVVHDFDGVGKVGSGRDGGGGNRMNLESNTSVGLP